MIADSFDANWKRNRRGCHIWQRAQAGKGAKVGRGYGCFRVAGKLLRAHVFAYERAYGALPHGLHVLHSCDEPRCVNPEHLRAGTNAENMREKAERGLAPRKLTPAKVRRIRALCGSGLSRISVSKRFGVCSQTVDEIMHRKIWRHVA